MSTNKEAIPRYKVVLLGEGRVGKTSILLRFVENSYVEGRPSTLTASYLEKHVGPIYYRDAKGAILVYDITDESTFDRVKSWTKELRKMVGDNTKICITIVGNKIDLERRRVVSQQSASKYAESVGATFFEVSAKTGRGVANVFEELTKVLLDTVKNPSCRSRSSLMEASSSMMGSSSGGQEFLHSSIDLSRKDLTKSSCCSV